MSLDTTPVPELSGQQRRCHALLLLFTPTLPVKLETISQLNGVGLPTTRQDIAEVANEIQRFYHLDIRTNPAEDCQLQGTLLNKRLCLIHWLRRGLRYCPEFIDNNFVPALHQALQWQGENAVLPPLQAIVEQCEHHLPRPLDERDRYFLQIYLAYAVWENQQQSYPQLEQQQVTWLSQKVELTAAESLFYTLNNQLPQPLASSERDVFILTLTMIKAHSYSSNHSPEDARLMDSIHRLLERFQQISGMVFSSDDELISQLFAHLAPAIERCRFHIGVDNILLDEISSKYPRLLRTTREALTDFEREYQIEFSADELGLIAISFGAWLMQGNALQEKQILLLTDGNPELEQRVEQQLRELTLLPLYIKYLSYSEYLKSGAPPGANLVISPYKREAPEPTPPLIQVLLPLTKADQIAIRRWLETP
ncbi:stationary phase inducible protein CsiE [Yersinia nurmii]|uniref:Stationary phase inducible protein CsiE n=1 Tax=Yersinia nurmii TaxID=685706 RepID=A0AAW7JXS1_9GAMM|nr:stationary phase inducible protein CsiE [Yersinia nurmii]MDN0087568.1 stationary phase inducible protein CsiE [Yersinia nurmii]